MQHEPGFLKLVDEAKSRIKEHSADEVMDMIEQGTPFHLVDVREESEWVAGRIRGAVHIGKGVIERDVERMIPDREASIVLYCGGGYRSALAAEALQKMGYTGVSSMAGGWRTWKASGFPTEY